MIAVAALQTMALIWLICLAAAVIFAVIGLFMGVTDERRNEDRKGDAGIQESEAEKWEWTDGY